ncbi:MAG: signal recognition particle-docking protein FtsY [archaeon]|nr:signal recognition particle-docking protein FtsY [archaeon]
MFDLLKKKLSGFTEKFKKKVEPADEKKEILIQEPVKEPVPKPILKKPKPLEKPTAVQEKPKAVEVLEEAEVEEIAELEEPTTEEAMEIAEIPEEQPRELTAKVSKFGRLKKALGAEITIHESDVKDLLWELELSLLEADVEQTTAEEISKELKQRLVGKKIKKGQNIDSVLKSEIRSVLATIMKTEGLDLEKEIRAKKEKPYRILFLGPNGAGKTTTIAKLTHRLQEKGLKVLWSASDTFRAASIEQLEKHAANLKVRVVKHSYGADPAAVAFDAIKAAQSRGIDVVMIDSAGRQETDSNLMQELNKIVRVTQPDLRIYIGEAFTGQALLQQAQEYDKVAGVDAFILTKIDCDAKGGTTISLLYKLKKPILFVGVGQEYPDLKKFDPEFVLKQVIG